MGDNDVDIKPAEPVEDQEGVWTMQVELDTNTGRFSINAPYQNLMVCYAMVGLIQQSLISFAMKQQPPKSPIVKAPPGLKV